MCRSRESGIKIKGAGGSEAVILRPCSCNAVLFKRKVKFRLVHQPDEATVVCELEGRSQILSSLRQFLSCLLLPPCSTGGLKTRLCCYTRPRRTDPPRVGRGDLRGVQGAEPRTPSRRRRSQTAAEQQRNKTQVTREEETFKIKQVQVQMLKYGKFKAFVQTGSAG